MAEKVKVSPQFKRLCTQFGRILGGESEVETGPVCFVMRATALKETILGRRTLSPLVSHQLFSFESLDQSGRALCLGETACHQNQANRLIRNLQSRGIKVTALHNHWLQEKPRLMYIHWESIDHPLAFARKTKESIAFLGSRDMGKPVKASPRFTRLCNQFSTILGGTDKSIIQGPVCFVSRTRIFKATILGRRTTSPLVQYQLFSFEDLDQSGRALCLGETACRQDQANRLIRNLQSRGITVTALHNHWLNENPRLMYIHWESIDHPVAFARKTKESIAFLG